MKHQVGVYLTTEAMECLKDLQNERTRLGEKPSLSRVVSELIIEALMKRKGNDTRLS